MTMKPELRESKPGPKHFGSEAETLTKQHHQWLKKKKHLFTSWCDGPSPELEAKVYTL